MSRHGTVGLKLFVAILYSLSTTCLLHHPAVMKTHAAAILPASLRSPPPSYKPVIIVHGIISNSSEMAPLRDAIAAAHPGTVVYDTNFYPNQLSLTDLWTQVAGLGAFVKNVSDQNPDGFHILGYSQGGLAVRGILQTFADLNVRNFIALSSPMNGQYGEDEIKWFPLWAKKNLHVLLYTPIGQKISVGNYWRDPHHLAGYYRQNIFLPVLNNESSILHPDSAQFKTNFLRIQKLVLVGGKNDGIITPYQSAFFDAYDEHENVVDVKNLDIYTKDYFGLKTLDELGAIFRHNVSGIKHAMWPRDPTVLENCILPYLD